MVKVVVVDYGVGNLHSIRRGLEMAGAKAEITRDIGKIQRADGVVLPGVGAFTSAMNELSKDLDVIKQSISSGKPMLGVCLGMQLMLTSSEEGSGKGLNVVPGKVVRLPDKCKVPQMGWNSIEVEREHQFLSGVSSGAYVYFVHSYITKPKDKKTILATTEYCTRFPSVIAKGAVVGTQFHPEKSGEVGLQMLRNFVELVKR
jgi:glutamine amidotransferase